LQVGFMLNFYLALQLTSEHFCRAACRIRQTFAEIKNAKCHRADLILRKRNHNRSKKLIAMIKEEESLSAFYRKLNRPDFVTTQTLVDEVVQDLTANGFSVIDNFLNTKCMNEVRDDIAVMCSNRGFYPGKLCHTGGGNAVRSVRSDLVRWLDVKHDCEYSAIHMAVRCMDKVASVLNNSRILRGCDIRSRSPAMIAYYPAKSSGYKQHVDNPNKDGRKLTFILYANTEYDQLRHGGMLRIHQKEQRLYFDIEPINGRLVIFWSDSRTPHEVLPTHKDRYAISVWYFDLIERARNFLNLPSNEEQQMLETCSIP